jgi:Domain of unknown function (DUF4157)
MHDLRTMPQQRTAKPPETRRSEEPETGGATSPARLVGRDFTAIPARGGERLPVAAVDDALEHEARVLADRATGIDRRPPPASDHRASGLVPPAGLGAGDPLDPAIRQRFERPFGIDFSRVRVHTGARAADAACGIGALAYTVGTDVVYGRGRPDMSDGPGAWLIAHELAHVVQHAQGRGAGQVHRQPVPVSELDRQLREALERGDYRKAAEVLNAFSTDDILKRIGPAPGPGAPLLSRGRIASLHLGALENPLVGKDANVAVLTRAAYLDVNYENARARGDWQAAAEFLNGFDEPGIVSRLGKLDIDQMDAVRAGAVANPKLGPGSAAAVVSARELKAARLEKQVRGMQERGELTLPESTAGAPGKLTTITVGTSAGSDSGVPEGDREPLAPETDWSKNPGYIDNDIAGATYNLLTNLFEVRYTDGRFIHLDYDSVKRASRAGGGAPAIGVGGLFFRNRGDGRIYPTRLTAERIPTIAAMVREIVKREPEALAATEAALIEVAFAAHGSVSSIIQSGKMAAAADAPLKRGPRRGRTGDKEPPDAKPDTKKPAGKPGEQLNLFPELGDSAPSRPLIPQPSAGAPSGGTVPRLDVAEIKSVQSEAAGWRQVNSRKYTHQIPDTGHEGVITYDAHGNVHGKVRISGGDEKVIFDQPIGTVPPSKLPQAQYGTKAFGDAIEDPIRELLEDRTGQRFLIKKPSATGPDILPHQPSLPAVPQ